MVVVVVVVLLPTRGNRSFVFLYLLSCPPPSVLRRPSFSTILLTLTLSLHFFTLPFLSLPPTWLYYNYFLSLFLPLVPMLVLPYSETCFVTTPVSLANFLLPASDYPCPCVCSCTIFSPYILSSLLQTVSVSANRWTNVFLQHLSMGYHALIVALTCFYCCHRSSLEFPICVLIHVYATIV